MSWLDWSEEALDELADIYVLATPEDREAIARHVAGLNKALADDPFSVGEEREGDLRIDAKPVLTVWFRVTPDGLLVRVIHAHKASRRSR